MLSLKNNHPRDKRIRFVEDSHTYYVDGSSEGYISSTTLVHKLFEKFDADKVISKMRKSYRWKSSPYYGMTDEEIKEKWNNNRDCAASSGTKMHENIENYYNQQEHSTEGKEFSLFKLFEDDHKDLKPYRSEWCVFDEEAKVSGSIDMVYEDPDDSSKLIIGDWKRSKEIKFENKWQKGISPHTSHLDDCNFVHYSLQLSMYKYILEKNYDKKISECFIVVLHPNQDSYNKYHIMDLSNEISSIFNERMGKNIIRDSCPKKRNIYDNNVICSMDKSFLKF